MNYITLKGTDLEISQLALGTGNYAWDVPVDISEQLLAAFYDNGGTMFDTAHFYGITAPGNRPLSEICLGNWLKKNNLRNRVIVSTKGCCYEPGRIDRKRLTPKHLQEDLEDSLCNLHTDYIDFYWLHQDDPSQPVEPIIDALNNYVKEGKIRYFGCSNWNVDRMRLALEYAKQSGQQYFSAIQVMYNLAFPNMDFVDELLQTWMTDRVYHFLEENDIPFFAYTSQAKGYFVNYFKEDFKINSKYARGRKYFENHETLMRIKRAKQLADELGTTPEAIALAYVMSQSVQGIPVVGPQSMEEMESTLQSSNVRITPEQIKFLIEY